MKIGILSDTHGNLSVARKASKTLRDAGVGAVFHCGDIGGTDVLEAIVAVFQPIDVPIHVVYGNMDVYREDWKYLPTKKAVHMHNHFGEIECAGKRIALLHSDDRSRFHHVVASGQYDLVLTGHTHAVHDYYEGRTRCINPGTAGRGSPDTCAVLDLEDGTLSIRTL